MQNQTPKHIVCKRPLVAERLAELALVGRVRLDAQRGREHELADCGGEAGEEGVEWLGGNVMLDMVSCWLTRETKMEGRREKEEAYIVSSNDTVHKLHNP